MWRDPDWERRTAAPIPSHLQMKYMIWTGKEKVFVNLQLNDVITKEVVEDLAVGDTDLFHSAVKSMCKTAFESASFYHPSILACGFCDSKADPAFDMKVVVTKQDTYFNDPKRFVAEARHVCSVVFVFKACSSMSCVAKFAISKMECKKAFKTHGLHVLRTLDQRCSRPECHEYSDSMHRCVCGVAFYCRPECQKLHWKSHKKYCKMLRSQNGATHP